MTEVEEVSLRPLSLRPGGGGFSAFSKGAGLGLRATAKPTFLTPLVPDEPRVRKPPGQIIRYDRDTLLKFMDRYIKAPLELAQSQLEIVIAEDTDREPQRQAIKQPGEEAEDGRDWRARAPLPPPPASGPGSTSPAERGAQGSRGGAAAGGAAAAAGPAAPQRAAQVSAEALRIQRAEDVGRQAYKVGTTSLDEQQRAVRSVKGILNKLTPEKFDRLLRQLLEVIVSAEVLKATIGLVFENAVAQPTFCAMYAELCLCLAGELPAFPPPVGEDKPLAFKRVLLNTCQDEFEGAAAAREELADVTDPEERVAAEKRVKSRTLGTVRLIAELYRKEVVKEAIILVCLRELLENRPPTNKPPEDNIESACEMITLTGKMLAGADNKKTRDALEAYMARLTRLGDDKGLPSRLRFLIRDVLDMRKNKWVPRREAFTAKKLDEVHAEAEAELGMVVSSRLVADLPALPTAARRGGEELGLLPPLRGGGDGWEVVGRRGISKPTFGAGGSALVGEYRPPEPLRRPSAPEAEVAAAAAEPVAAAAANAPRAAGGKPLSADDVASKARSFMREYLSVGDAAEAGLCLQELRAAPKEGDVADLSGVVCAAVEELFDTQSDKAAGQLVELLVSFMSSGQLNQDETVAALRGFTSTLGDLALDVPKAPQLLGRLFGAALSAGALPLAVLPELLEGAEGAEAKRGFGAAALKPLAAAGGLAAAAAEAQLDAAALFAADEFDGDLPDVAAWAAAAGLTGLPL